MKRIRISTVLGLAAMAAAPILHADLVTGSLTGTVDPGQGADPLNIFGCPAMDCTGETVTAKWSYDPSQFGPYTTGPGFSEANGQNMGTISETINGHTHVVDSSFYFSYYAGTAPAQPNDLFQIGADTNTEPYGAGTVGSYTLLTIEPGGTFLSGLGPVQNFSGPLLSDSSGALEITYTEGDTQVGETLQFLASRATLSSVPEPASFLLMGSVLLAAAGWARRRRA